MRDDNRAAIKERTDNKCPLTCTTMPSKCTELLVRDLKAACIKSESKTCAPLNRLERLSCGSLNEPLMRKKIRPATSR